MRILRTLFCCGTMLGAPTVVLAQDLPALAESTARDTASSESDGDIVVTALRRDERLQDVPVSITAIGGDQLTARRISGAADLVGSVPNLQASVTSGEGTPIFALRGVSMSDYSINQQSPVATYFDEVYKGSFPLLPLGLYDLERVEVLRGPQGTLYGKNTTGGAINFISRKPTLGEANGYLQAGYGNYNRREAEGALNLPLGETLAFRGAFTFARADGWFDNVLPNRPSSNATRQYAVRGSLLLEPSDRFNMILRANTSLQNPGIYGILGLTGPNGAGAGLYEAFGQTGYVRTGLGKRQGASDYEGFYRHRTNGVALNANWKATDTLTVTSVTSFDYGTLDIGEDADGTPLQVIHNDTRAKAKQFAQDLRIASDFAAGPNFIFGAYYNREVLRAGYEYRYLNDLDADQSGMIDFQDCLVTFFLSCISRNQFHQKKTSAALYSDFNWLVTDKVTLRAGLRFTRDTGALTEFRSQLLGADRTPIANLIPGDLNDFDATTDGPTFRQNNLSGKIGVDFKVADNRLIYLSYSRGYRGSAFNAQALFSTAELRVADPETINAYEAGFKTQFFGRKLTLNGAVFYYDYKNQQALRGDPNTPGLQLLYNIPKSKIVGAELEMSARVSSRFRVNLGVGLLDSEINGGDISGQSLDGKELPGAPKLSVNGGIEADLMSSESGKLTAAVEANYSSKRYFELLNVDRISQDRYAVLNGRLTYRTGNERLGVSLWGKNLTNSYYYTASVDGSALGIDYFHVSPPREYGFTVDVRF